MYGTASETDFYDDIGFQREWMAGFSKEKQGHILDAQGISAYRAKFEGRYEGKAVPSDSFTSPFWMIDDGKRQIRIRFSSDEAAYRDGAGAWIGLSFGQFCEAERAYIAKCLGSYVAETLQDYSRRLVKLGTMSLAEVLEEPFDPVHLDFLRLLPGDPAGRRQAAGSLMEKLKAWKAGPRKQRELAPLGTYMDFFRRTESFFKSCSEDQRKKYYPIRLWWDIGSVLPLRATEFLLTPKDCLRVQDGSNFLTIRSSVKKKGKRKVYYDIRRDYQMYEYRIGDAVADTVRRYQAMAEGIRPQGNWSLLLPEDPAKGYLDYPAMRELLQEFLVDQLGFDSPCIRLGDTRHLAMINIALSGASPEVCMALARHEDIDIASSYYSNLSTFVGSAIFSSDEEDTVRIVGKAALPADPETMMRVRDGWCDDRGVPDGDVGGCLKNYRQAGHLGDCYGCVHFHPEQLAARIRTRDEMEGHLDLGWDGLLAAIDLLAEDAGHKDGLLSAMDKLRNSAFRYAGQEARRR